MKIFAVFNNLQNVHMQTVLTEMYVAFKPVKSECDLLLHHCMMQHEDMLQQPIS